MTLKGTIMKSIIKKSLAVTTSIAILSSQSLACTAVSMVDPTKIM